MSQAQNFTKVEDLPDPADIDMDDAPDWNPRLKETSGVSCSRKARAFLLIFRGCHWRYGPLA